MKKIPEAANAIGLISYVLVPFLALFAFLGGLLLPLGAFFIFLSVLAAGSASVFFIVIAIKYRVIKPAIFSVLLVLAAGACGCYLFKSKDDETIATLQYVRSEVIKYKVEKGTYPQDLREIPLKGIDAKTIRFRIFKDCFELDYRAGIIACGSDFVSFRPSP